MKRILAIFDLPLSDYCAIWALTLFVTCLSFWGKVVELAVLAGRFM